MAAYTDAQKIANYLGVTLTSAQQTQAGILAQAASDWIDDFKGRSWQDDGTVTDERHTIYGDRVYLNYRPVTAVSAVKTRAFSSDATVTTLTTSQWELLDAINGIVLITGWAGTGSLALVSYTHTATVAPSQVALAATIIAASWLGPTLRPNSSGLESVSVGQNDVSVKFRADFANVPAEALTLLGARGVVVA